MALQTFNQIKEEDGQKSQISQIHSPLDTKNVINEPYIRSDNISSEGVQAEGKMSRTILAKDMPSGINKSEDEIKVQISKKEFEVNNPIDQKSD